MKAAHLLDVNVLVAMSWPAHVHHEKAQRWFAQHASRGWASCPMTEAGFIRIISSPAFSPHAVSIKDALDALKSNTSHPKHEFWPDHLAVAPALSGAQDRIVGHKQVTDAYLLALAIHHSAKLATLDRGLAKWAAEGPGRAHVELVE
jgi:toxin-antitoxin system PIN domain toxin